MHIDRGLLLLMVLAMVSLPLAAATLYVSPTGNDTSGDGSQAKPWKTVGYAIGQVADGDTIHLQAGATFAENVYINAGQGGSAGAPVTLTSDPNNRAILAPPNAGAEGLLVWNTGYLVVENLKIQGVGSTATDKAGVAAMSDGAQYPGVTFRNLEVSKFAKGMVLYGWGSATAGFSNAWVENCDFHDNEEVGLSTWCETVGGIRDLTIRNCRAYNNRGDPNTTSTSTGSGIVLGQVIDGVIEHCIAWNNGEFCKTTGGPVAIWAYDCTRVTIQSCEAYDNHAINCDGGGFDLDGGCQDCVIQYCYSHDNDGAGYLICQYSGARAYTNNTIRYNISQNDGRRNGFAGIHFYSAGSSGGLQNTKIYGNTIYNSISHVVRFQNTSGQTGTKLWNNIFIAGNGKPLLTGDPVTTVATFQGNCWYAVNNTYSIAGYTSLSAWQAGKGQEMLSGAPVGQQANPLCASPGAGGIIGDTTQLHTLSAYTLQDGSPCIDAGLDLPALFGTAVGSRDFYNKVIPNGSHYDTGAHDRKPANQPPSGVAPAPALREQISLNGTWHVVEKYWQDGVLHTRSGDRTVPEYRWQIVGSQDGDPVDDDTFVRWEWGQQSYTYTRTVSVPAAWSGKRIVLEVERANFKPSVAVNGTTIGSFLPPYVPFAVDLTDHASPGGSLELAITVQADWVSDYKDANGYYLWPVGGWSEIGVLGDLWLRAYGQVAIADAFIQTSVREGTLKVDYELFNSTATERAVTIAGTVSPATGGAAVKALSSGSVSLAAGERRVVSVVVDWDDAVLWHPQNPHLYHLRSRLLDGAAELDGEERRFGFREIWIEGTTFRLNGVRLNLRGDSTAPHGIRFADNEDFFTPDTFNDYLAFLRSVNANVFRHHTYPAATFMLERCDEVGMLVIDESALRGDPGKYSRTNAILHNMRDHWIGPWVRSHRNHPSLIMWSAENEGFLWNITNADMLSLGNRIRNFDTTRPVCYCGDSGVNDAIKSMHYPEGYGKSPSGSIYAWTNKLHASRPTAVSEFCTEYLSDTRTQHTTNFWWQGTWSRGLRYIGFADIRPYTLIWAAGAAWDQHWSYGYGPNPVDEPEAVSNLANSFNPVALFDKAYDDLGIAPLMNGTHPSLVEGATVTRTLILYNDEFASTSVTVNVSVKSGATLHASGSTVIALALGEHVDIPCTFQVPYIGGAQMQLVLATSKGGTQRFTETKVFNVTDAGSSGTSSPVVIIGNPPPPVNQPPTVDAGAGQTITLPDGASLNGTVDDDGLPNPPAAVTTTWTKASGPGTVSFGKASAVDTTASFSAAGTYVLRLTASDGALSANDTVTISVNPAPSVNQAPVVDSVAWADPNPVILPATTTAAVVATDSDGDTLTYTWSKVSGPGTVDFSPNGAESSNSSTATFSIDGDYVLRVTVDDGNGGTVTSDVSITADPSNLMRADVNDDGVVNVDDLFLVTSHFGQVAGDTNWDARADADGDGKVNVTDLSLVTTNFGKAY